MLSGLTLGSGLLGDDKLADPGHPANTNQPTSITGRQPMTNADQASAAMQHFDTKGKLPSSYTIEFQKALRRSLPFEDQRDFDEAQRGFIAAPDYKQIILSFNPISRMIWLFKSMKEPEGGMVVSFYHLPEGREWISIPFFMAPTAGIEAGQMSRNSNTQGLQRTTDNTHAPQAQKNCGEVDTITSGRFWNKPAMPPMTPKEM
jgi:hypothetical protein